MLLLLQFSTKQEDLNRIDSDVILVNATEGNED
jgi:hypothetical protein